MYKPQRRYRKPASGKVMDEETQIHSTLLEYGRSVYNTVDLTMNQHLVFLVECHTEFFLLSNDKLFSVLE